MIIFDPTSYQELRITRTDIPGLLVVALAVHGDGRGWFKQNYNQDSMRKLGFPGVFNVVENDISFNARRGVTRGIHAEPWDKYISLATGSLFAVIVDMRAGDNFGKILTFELNPGISLFIPNGCGHAFQTQVDGTVYSYLSNSHMPEDQTFTCVNLADPDLKIQWPVPIELAEISDKDKNHPMLKDTQPLETSLEHLDKATK